jgi:hypothetical protein
MLMDHADAAINGIAGTGKMDLFSIDRDCPAVGTEETVKNVHEGGFARTVLSNQGMDFTLSDEEFDVIICEHQRKLFGNMSHFDGKLCHGVTTSREKRFAWGEEFSML